MPDPGSIGQSLLQHRPHEVLPSPSEILVVRLPANAVGERADLEIRSVS